MQCSPSSCGCTTPRARYTSIPVVPPLAAAARRTIIPAAPRRAPCPPRSTPRPAARRAPVALQLLRRAWLTSTRLRGITTMHLCRHSPRAWCCSSPRAWRPPPPRAAAPPLPPRAAPRTRTALPPARVSTPAHEAPAAHHLCPQPPPPLPPL